MMRVGFVGWRGMVGSVLVQRMLEESDFELIEPVFFSTSRAGGQGPAIGRNSDPLKDASNPEAFAGLDAIVTCQGGDWTRSMHGKLRSGGWNGYWIDAASTLRMADDAVIVLDPVNRDVIDQALDKGVKNYIGGNCTVSLMMMAIAGLLQHDLVEWLTCMTYQSASGAGAQNMRELLQQMGEAHLAAKDLLDDPASSILDIDREVAGILRDERFPTKHFEVPLAGSLIPWIAEDMGDGVSREEWKGGAETNKILGRQDRPIAVESICVRVGAMRCHSQALTIKLRRKVPLAQIEKILAGANEWVRVVPNTRDASMRELTPAAVTGKLEIPIGRLRKLAIGDDFLAAFTVGDQLLWGAAEPLRRMLRILLRR
ncbi:MAG: aspartate-semialdehyde dehydrogenase [Betaproteobacteria bacterium]|nr:MAG: aspartate-semialdehyde dehydrogenase [Betaproteobacteria bacterium]